MKKSLIISHITSCDYPLWRLWIKKYSSFFDEILIYFDIQFRYPIFTSFIQSDLSTISNIKFLDPIEVHWDKGEDWRNVSTNELVKHSTGDWLISIEQDWFTESWEQLFSSMEHSMQYSDMFGWMNRTNTPYLHPAFWAIKRELLEKTSKDFAAHPDIDGSDHFATITYNVQNLNAKIIEYEGDFTSHSPYFHLGGVNENYRNVGNPEYPFYRPEAFKIYNKACMELTGVWQDDRFYELMVAMDEKLRNIPYHPEWEKYFVI